MSLGSGFREALDELAAEASPVTGLADPGVLRRAVLLFTTLAEEGSRADPTAISDYLQLRHAWERGAAERVGVTWEAVAMGVRLRWEQLYQLPDRI
ncbi:MAG: hypothetical protein ACK47B_17155 [Armatimonadota bacterium]